MRILSLLYKIFLCFLFLISILALLYLTWFARQFPWKRSVPASDPVWTSPAYVAQFPNAAVDFPYVESFIYEGFLPFLDIREEVLRKKCAWEGGVVDRGLFEDFLALWWVERCNMLANPAHDIRIPSPALPAIGTVGGTASIRATVTSITKNSMVFAIAMRAAGLDHGFEVVELEMTPMDVKMTVKYIWHRRMPPRWWKVQWLAIYLQLLGRLVCMGNVFQTVRKGALPVGENFMKMDL